MIGVVCCDRLIDRATGLPIVVHVWSDRCSEAGLSVKVSYFDGLAFKIGFHALVL